jgi:hypothetical protein
MDAQHDQFTHLRVLIGIVTGVSVTRPLGISTPEICEFVAGSHSSPPENIW